MQYLEALALFAVGFAVLWLLAFAFVAFFLWIMEVD